MAFHPYPWQPSEIQYYNDDLDALRANKRNVYRLTEEPYFSSGRTFGAALNNFNIGRMSARCLCSDDQCNPTYYDDLDEALSALYFQEIFHKNKIEVTYSGEELFQGWRIKMTMQYIMVAERETEDQQPEYVFTDFNEDSARRPKLVASLDIPHIKSPYGEYEYQIQDDAKTGKWSLVAPDDTSTAPDPAAQLKHYRELAGLTKQQLAEAAGISVPAIEKYENGTRRLAGASVDTVIKIARALTVPIESLIG